MRVNKEMKRVLYAVYFMLCLILVCVEVKESCPFVWVALYYSFVLLNFWNSVRLLKK